MRRTWKRCPLEPMRPHLYLAFLYSQMPSSRRTAPRALSVPTKSWTTIDTENFAVVVTTNLAQMQISVDILLPQTVGQSFTELSHTPHILSDVTVCITKTELLGV